MLRILLCLISLSAFAETESYNRVDFQVEAAREVANDLLVTTLSADIQDRQPALVAKQLNTALNSAIKLATGYSSVRASSGNQYTTPVYGKNNQISLWRGHSEIRLESRDFKAAGELIMQLQSTLQLGGMQFTLAPDTRLQIENELVTEAIKAFQNRGDAIRVAFGAKSYKTVHFAINSGDLRPPMLRSMADSAIPTPEFAAGSGRMTVQISGTIELQY